MDGVQGLALGRRRGTDIFAKWADFEGGSPTMGYVRHSSTDATEILREMRRRRGYVAS